MKEHIVSQPRLGHGTGFGGKRFQEVTSFEKLFGFQTLFLQTPRGNLFETSYLLRQKVRGFNCWKRCQGVRRIRLHFLGLPSTFVETILIQTLTLGASVNGATYLA